MTGRAMPPAAGTSAADATAAADATSAVDATAEVNATAAMDATTAPGASSAMDATAAVIDILTGTWRAQALHAAAVLEIPDHVAAGRTDSRALSAATGTARDGVERLMRLLVAMGVFAGSDAGGYRLTPLSERLRRDAAGSLHAMCVLYGAEFHRAWGSVVTAVRSGQAAFTEAFGQSLHSYLATTPGADDRFQQAMKAGDAFFADVASAFDFTGARLVVDVAGGGGRLLATVLRSHPRARGILFDLPHVTEYAAGRLAQEIPGGRATAMAGDMFERVPGGGDVYLLSRVLQDWDDARCVRLLANCRSALSGTGRVLIVERVIDDGGGTLLPILWDMHLLVVAGGRERTLEGYRSLLRQAGLRLEAVRPLALETSLLVARP